MSFSLGGFDWQLALYMWISVVLTGAVAWLLSRRATAGVPGVGQTMMEFVFGFIGDLAGGSMDVTQNPGFLSYLVMLFLFLLVANFQGMIPGLHSPTANLNVTAALALMTFGLMWYRGFRSQGVRYLNHWFHPGGITGYLMFPINVIEDFSKPLTLAFRLFGNILVGEVFMEVIADATGFGYFKGGFALGFAWWGFTAFVNLVQTFIFMILTLSYVAQAQAHEL